MSDLDGLQPGEVVEFKLCRYPERWRYATVLEVKPSERLATIRSNFTGQVFERLFCELRRVAEPRPEAVRAEK